MSTDQTGHVVASDEELATLVAARAAELGRLHPDHTVRVIISTCPPNYPDTDERPARPFVIDRPPPVAGLTSGACSERG